MSHRWAQALLSLVIALALPFFARANVIGTDTQNFNTITSGLDFVTVQSSETLQPGVVNLGLFFNYAVNSLPYFSSSPQGPLNFNDTILGMDMNAGLGLGRNWDVGVSFPQVLRQSVSDQTGARGEFAATGATEIRLNTKYRLLGDATGGVAVVSTVNFNRIQNNPFMGTNPGPTYNIEAVADRTIGKVAIGGNLGYRIRNPGTALPNAVIRPLDDQIIASVAASYHFPHLNTKAIGEIFGSLPADSGADSNVARSLSSLEVLAGAKYDVNTNLALHAGGGMGVGEGFASPDWRLYTGLNYTFGPVWSERQEPPGYFTQVRDEAPRGAPAYERFRTQKILFDFDSDRMVGNYDDVLAELADHLGTGFVSLTIEGHTDSIGSETYNQQLSLRRAQAIKRYLTSRHKIESRRISAIGYGETRPISDNGNYQGRQENRRVDFVIQR